MQSVQLRHSSVRASPIDRCSTDLYEACKHSMTNQETVKSNMVKVFLHEANPLLRLLSYTAA